MKKLHDLTALAISFFLTPMMSCSGNHQPAPDDRITISATQPDPLPAPTIDSTSIQVAILLDASNSMDGLIDQAKSRIWNIVNTLTTLKFRGHSPNIEIALYMYGNDGLSERTNYIKQVSPFTSNLDVFSEKLFSIRTNGGSEYCGAVIDHAVKLLDWRNNPDDMRLIYIAGNEPFNQGPVNYIEAVSGALRKEIYINTIHCGDVRTGINEYWKDGAIRGKGKYFCINSDHRIAFVETPYDKQIDEYNTKLNRTILYYGTQGLYAAGNAMEQDKNAERMSYSNKVERSVTKSKSVYKNQSWDLVDKAVEDTTYVDRVDMKTLPSNYQNMSRVELKSELTKKNQERKMIQKQIEELGKKRQLYIDNELAKNADNSGKDDFGKVVEASIYELALAKGYTVEK